MKSVGKAVLYGFLVWLIPFVASFFVFSLKKAGDPLFDTIMAVVTAVVGTCFSVLYLKRVSTGFLKEGLFLGVIFFAVSVGIDLLTFMWGPMKVSFAGYMKDIGLAYLVYPAITIGNAYLLAARSRP